VIFLQQPKVENVGLSGKFAGGALDLLFKGLLILKTKAVLPSWR
jgi:hypothetical protein